jgi:hypothetical protein
MFRASHPMVLSAEPGFGPVVSTPEAGGPMAKSDRKCPNEKCPMTGKWTSLAVCRHCYRATVYSIYQPRAHLAA